jgi:peroxiredoxin
MIVFQLHHHLPLYNLPQIFNVMPSSLIHTTAFTLLALALTAQESPPPSMLETEVRGLMDTFDDSIRANTLKIIAAKSEQERATFLASVPQPTETAAKVLNFINTHPDDPAALIGLGWVLERAANSPAGDTALTLLSSKYYASAGIASAVKALQYQALAKVQPVLDLVHEKNPNHPEQAAAAYALGGLYFQQYEGLSDPKAVAEARDKAMLAFSELTSTYSDVTVDGIKLSDSASQMLFELANLTEGNLAPDIEGADSSGVKFNLKDYRGQPVVLAFWSDGCHACHDVLPLLEKASAENAAKRIVPLGITGDTIEAAKASLTVNHVTMRTWADGSSGGSIQRLYNIRRFPTLYLLDSAGKILYKGSTLAQLIERMRTLP